MNITIVCTHPTDQIPGLRVWLRRVIAGMKKEGATLAFDLIEGPGKEQIGAMCRSLGTKVTLRTNGVSPITDFSYFDTLAFLPDDKKDDFISKSEHVLAFDKPPVQGMGDKLSMLDVGKAPDAEKRGVKKVNALDVLEGHEQKKAPLGDPYKHMNWVRDYQKNQEVRVPPLHDRKLTDEIREKMTPPRQDPFYEE